MSIEVAQSAHAKVPELVKRASMHSRANPMQVVGESYLDGIGEYASKLHRTIALVALKEPREAAGRNRKDRVKYAQSVAKLSLDRIANIFVESENFVDNMHVRAKIPGDNLGAVLLRSEALVSLDQIAESDDQQAVMVYEDDQLLWTPHAAQEHDKTAVYLWDQAIYAAYGNPSES